MAKKHASKFSQADRRRHLDAWRHSGLSQSAYCRLHDLRITTFNRWVHLLSEPAHKSLELVAVRLPAPEAHPVLSGEEVAVAGKSYNISTVRPNSSGLRIFLNDRFSVDIAGDFDANCFARVVSVLSEL